MATVVYVKRSTVRRDQLRELTELMQTGAHRDLRIEAKLTLDEMGQKSGGVSGGCVWFWERLDRMPTGRNIECYLGALRELQERVTTA